VAANIQPRKRRTRQHVIAYQSVNYVERCIIDCGHTALRTQMDYGYDLVLSTFDEQGYAEPGAAFLQLKASETLKLSGNAYVFDLDVRDYHLWIRERMPVFLVLFDSSRRRAFWLHVQRHFRKDTALRPRKGAKTVRVRVPGRQAVTPKAVAKMRICKQGILDCYPEEGR
jgi:Domain of unknown function (DUF4365)